uniref:Retroviral polymerase SH3-like domain-containing protein n=1 Tax=Nicotiana tabacum TaxID=4097 RepID=A0A1S3ZVU9_TOBAC|nr:PREDICTED: uncharacterized protein LOC107791021 [Nicotiana tabacum]
MVQLFRVKGTTEGTNSYRFSRKLHKSTAPAVKFLLAHATVQKQYSSLHHPSYVTNALLTSRKRTWFSIVFGGHSTSINWISACQSAKEIREALQTAHEGTTQVKQSKIDMLTTEYEIFRMKDDESIQDMHTCFTSIINELHSLGETIPRNKLVRKILSVLPSSWESKVNAITEAKDLQTLTIDELECPLLKQDQYKNNFHKAAKMNPVSDKRFKRMNAADNVIKQALAAWENSSSESEEENDHGDSLMMAVESEATDLINNKDALTVELGETEQTRDDLVIAVIDLKETIEILKKEKDALDEKIAHIEHERDDLMVVVIDLKESFECVRKEKEVLGERVANIEHERDDLLVVVVDLKEIIGELKMESRPENSQKRKEVASEAHIKLESEEAGSCKLHVAEQIGQEGPGSWCMIRSLLNKTPYELLNGRKTKLTHLRTFGCKCFVLNNRKEALGKFDAKSDEGIFLGYSSQSKSYKVYNKRTQCVEESIHMNFDESHLSCEKDSHANQDGKPLSVPGEVIDMANGRADVMSHVKESSEDDASTPPSIGEKSGPLITPTEAENRVVDAVQGTPLAEVRSTQEP